MILYFEDVYNSLLNISQRHCSRKKKERNTNWYVKCDHHKFDPSQIFFLLILFFQNSQRKKKDKRGECTQYKQVTECWKLIFPLCFQFFFFLSSIHWTMNVIHSLTIFAPAYAFKNIYAANTRCDFDYVNGFQTIVHGWTLPNYLPFTHNFNARYSVSFFDGK